MSKARRGGPRIQNERIGGMVILVVLLLVLFIVQQRNQAYSLSIQQNEEKIEALKESIRQEQERTRQIEQLRIYMTTDAYLEQAARERLGLVKENETLFEEALPDGQ